MIEYIKDKNINSDNQDIKESLLKDLIHSDNKCIKVDWEYVSDMGTLSEDFIRGFQDKVDWEYVSDMCILSESFIREFQDKVNWEYVSLKQKLSEDFIGEFKDKVDWDRISINQVLSESFIKEFQDKVNWFMVSQYQILSEEFIREFQDKVDWDRISAIQLLSESFIKEFQDKVNWSYIFRYQLLSKNLLIEFINKFKLKEYDISYLDILDGHTLIKNFREVKVYTNDIYGYKVLDSDSSSTVYSKLYELNKETERINCDTSKTICSFGYNFYLRLEDIEYNKEEEKIIKVLVKKEDIGVILYKENIGRCYKLTPIEIIDYDHNLVE